MGETADVGRTLGTAREFGVRADERRVEDTRGPQDTRESWGTGRVSARKGVELCVEAGGAVYRKGRSLAWEEGGRCGSRDSAEREQARTRGNPASERCCDLEWVWGILKRRVGAGQLRGHRERSMNAPGAAPAMRGAFSGFTRLSKGITAVLVAGYVCTALVPRTREFLALVPVRTIPFGWNLITAGVLETSLINVVVNVAALLLLGKLLEPIWGSKEFLKFILIVSTGTSLLTWVLMICLYYITQKEHFLYDKISGFHGVVAGFLVALKQLMPDQELSAVSVIKFRARWLSPIVVLLSITLCVVFGDPHAVLPFVIFGTYTSWMYLRFFQTRPEGNLKGDPSEEFSFASFFPDILRPLVGGVAWVFYRLFCSRAEAAPTDTNTGYILGGKPLPGSDPVDASRRRERGARALEERLNAVKAAQAAEAGNVANVEESSDAAAPSSGLPISNKPGVAARHEATAAADNSV